MTKFISYLNPAEVEIRQTGKAGLIELSKLNTGDLKKDEKILKELVKIAETYRYTISTYLEKGWFTSMGGARNLLKNYGFK